MIYQLLYDGTFDGFLTGVYEVYDRKLADASIIRRDLYQPLIGSELLHVVNDKEKSTRVWKGLRNKLSAHKRNEVFKSFLSELPSIENTLLEFCRHVFSNSDSVEQDLGNRYVIEISKIAHMVHREKHRMEAFVRFQRTKEDLYFASVEPDFNVLSLIAAHFKDRYADQDWLIYDARRSYGIHYNKQDGQVNEVQINLDDKVSQNILPASVCHEEEVEYQKLWKEYFYSVNIGARKNKKLHLRHVPSRYWKFLTEKK